MSMATPVESRGTVLPLQESNRDLEIIARRVAWWKTPAEALANTDDFLCRVMTFGLWSDVAYVGRMFGDDALRRALQNAPAGVFDPPSWHYWHYRLGFDQVPGLPKRTFQ
jgi:hypothetical protein